MDLIELLIRLIAKAFESPRTSTPTSNNPNDIVRQIQARIEAARLQDPRAQRPASQGPMRAQLRPPGRKQPPALKQRKTKRKWPPAVPAAVAKPTLAQAASVVTPRGAPPPPKPVISNVDAKVLARWLRPQTLRAQFILTEIFQPPLALRESRLF